MGIDVNSSGRTNGTGLQEPDGAKKGNAHNVTVEECREMAADPSRSHISKEDYDKLSEDMKACYTEDPENGGYKLTDEVYRVLDDHAAGASKDPV